MNVVARFYYRAGLLKEDVEMKEEGIIKVQTRVHSGGGHNKRLREEGLLPGVIYGKGMESIPVVVKKDELGKHLHHYGRNAVFKLDLDGEKTFTTKIKDIQHFDVMGGNIHVDFQKVTLSVETKSNVTIRLKGKETMEANKLIILQQLDSLPVKGLPRSIPESIEVDVSRMHAGESLTVGNLELPKGITSDMDADHLVVSVKESILQQTLEVEEVATGTIPVA